MQGSRSGYLRTNRPANAGLVLENQQPLFLFAHIVRASEYTRHVCARAEEGSVAREVDVCVDVYEQLSGGHGVLFLPLAKRSGGVRTTQTVCAISL